MVKWTAFNIIESSIKKTKETVLPIDRGYLLKLALITLLGGIGSGGTVNIVNPFNSFDKSNFNPSFEVRQTIKTMIGNMGDTLRQNIALIVLIVALILVLIILLIYLKSVLQFVFFQGVMDREIGIIQSVKKNLRNGLSLLVFRILLGVSFLIIFGISIIPFAVTMMRGYGTIMFLFSMLFGGITVIIAMIVTAILGMFAVDFVIPIMVVKNEGIWSSFKEILRLFRENILEFTIYILAKIVLGIAGGILSIILLIPLMIVWLILLVILGLGVWIISSVLNITIASMGIMGLILIIMIAVGILILFFYSAQLIKLPIPIFFRLYSVMFLTEFHDTINSLELCYSKPASVREK